MLQTALRPSCMNRGSVFVCHKRFKESSEFLRDDERCGRSKEVNTSELIGQIKSFMDKGRLVSIETIIAQFDVCVGPVHTIIHEELKMRKISVKFVLRVLREDQKERFCYDSRKMVELINSDRAVLGCSGDLRWKLGLLLWPRDQETEFLVEACWLSQTQEGQTEQIHTQTFDDSLFFLPHWHDLHAVGFHWTDSQQEMLCWGFRGVQRDSVRRGQHSSNWVRCISSRTMHQSTTPSLSQTIWPKLASRQFVTLPIVQSLLPVTFAYSRGSEAVVLRQFRRWKRLWRRSLARSH